MHAKRIVLTLIVGLLCIHFIDAGILTSEQLLKAKKTVNKFLRKGTANKNTEGDFEELLNQKQENREYESQMDNDSFSPEPTSQTSSSQFHPTNSFAQDVRNTNGMNNGERGHWETFNTDNDPANQTPASSPPNTSINGIKNELTNIGYVPPMNSKAIKELRVDKLDIANRIRDHFSRIIKNKPTWEIEAVEKLPVQEHIVNVLSRLKDFPKCIYDKDIDTDKGPVPVTKYDILIGLINCIYQFDQQTEEAFKKFYHYKKWSPQTKYKNKPEFKTSNEVSQKILELLYGYKKYLDEHLTKEKLEQVTN